jgi:hypothetical protein
MFLLYAEMFINWNNQLRDLSVGIILLLWHLIRKMQQPDVSVSLCVCAHTNVKLINRWSCGSRILIDNRGVHI